MDIYLLAIEDLSPRFGGLEQRRRLMTDLPQFVHTCRMSSICLGLRRLSGCRRPSGSAVRESFRAGCVLRGAVPAPPGWDREASCRWR
jgi:hypothetical protein